MKEAAPAFEELCRDIAGLPVTHVWRGHGSMICIELGELSRVFKRDGTSGGLNGQVSLMIEWDWRLESETEILCGSSGNEELWLPMLERLIEQRVRSCEVSGPVPEISLLIESGIRLRSFSCVEGNPRWTIFDRLGAGTVRWFSVKDGLLAESDNGAQSQQVRTLPK